MDILAITGILAALVGIIAGIVQVVQYIQERRSSKLDQPKPEAQVLPILPASKIPHNLPPRSEFIGRKAEKARVHEALRSRSYLVSIDGIGGIGKTVLALEVAHECLRASKDSRDEGSPDGIATFSGFIWTTAKDRDLTLNHLLDAVARTLEYPGIAQQPVEEKRFAVRRLLQEKPYLLIVDNFETITDDNLRDFLLELPEPSKALITTREQKLRQVWAISLKGLAEPEALALIRSAGRRLGLTALERGEDPVLLRLFEATGGAPLAIKWVVGQIKQKGQSLDTALAALYEARGSIFSSIFDRSWGLLHTSARQVLVVMPIFATSASRAGIEAASDVHHFVLDEALGLLIEMSLVDATDELDLARMRYSIHPLTRSFAKVRLSEDPTLEAQSRSRLTTYYAEACKEIGRWGYTQYFPWLEVELPNIIAAIEWAYRAQKWSAVTSIFDHLFYFLGTRGYWQERLKYGQMALRAAQEADDRPAMAVFQHSLAWILSRQGQHSEAEQLLHACIQSCMDMGETREAVRAMTTLAKIAVTRSDLDLARKVIDEATKLIEEAGYERIPPGLLSAQGRLELRSGNLEAAHALLLRALEDSQGTGPNVSTGSRQIDLGNVALARGQLEEAASYFEGGLKTSQHFRRQDNIAKAKLGLAKVHVRRGKRSEAIRLAQTAQEQFARMGMEVELSEVDALLHRLRNSRGQST